MTSNKMCLPEINKITTTNFSLYSLKDEIVTECNRGVTCLAGANGLGKSTFLISLNYGLTGIVAEPSRKFLSVDEYYRHSIEFSENFFAGRISEVDRETAEIKIDFLISSQHFEIVRGMFEPRELRYLKINSKVCDDSDPGRLQDIYAEKICEATGLSSFEQFVFIQHFITSFDERRHLIFWDPKALEQALYLAFGLDPGEAEKADNLRRQVEKAESLARNYNWQATELREKLKSLESTEYTLTKDSKDLQEEYSKIEQKLERALTKKELKEKELQDTNLRLADIISNQVILKAEYAEIFSRFTAMDSYVNQNPIVLAALNEKTCKICGFEGLNVKSAIKQKLDSQTCPFCCNAIKTSRNSTVIPKLKNIDVALTRLNKRVEECVLLKKRLQEELQEFEAESKKAESEFDQYSNRFKDKLYKGDVAPIILEYRTRIEELLKKKKGKYKERDEYKERINLLQKKLIKQYSQAEKEFVPLFKGLANEFLGIDLDVRLDPSLSRGINFVFEMQGSARREHHQLSESQRFFVDIALRMAIAKYISKNVCRPTLFIDTPEGSLDIAYETKAGSMFAKFVTQGGNLIMTANINSSNLLTTLAKKCGRSRMSLIRMTSWTELTEVQSSQENLFEIALGNIEKALGK